MSSWNEEPPASRDDDPSAEPPPRPTYAPMAVPPPPGQPAGPPVRHAGEPAGQQPAGHPAGQAPGYPAGAQPPPGTVPQPPPGAAPNYPPGQAPQYPAGQSAQPPGQTPQYPNQAPQYPAGQPAQPPAQTPQYPNQAPQYPAGQPAQPPAQGARYGAGASYPGAAPQYPGPPPYPSAPGGWGPQPPQPAAGAGTSRRRVIVAGSVAAAVAAGGGVAAWLLTRGDDKSAAPPPKPNPTTPAPVPPGPPALPEPPTTESGPYTLTVWLEKIYTPGVDQAKTTTDLTAALVKADPLGTVRSDVQEYIDQTKLDTALAAGNGPDLFQVDSPSLARRVKQGTLLDLTPYAKRLNADSWHPAARAACTLDGKLYALPMDVYAPVVLYDKRLCDPAGFVVPTTRDEWITQLDKLKQHYASDPKFEALHLVGRAWQAIAACLFASGCEIAVPQNERWAGRLNTDAGRAGIAFFQKLQSYSSAPKNVEEYKDPAGNIIAVLTAGKSAMAIQPDWVVAELLRTSPETARNLGAFPMPGTTAGKPATVGVWAGVLAVSAKTEHPVGASNLLRVMSSSVWQERWANENETVPALGGLTTTSGAANPARAATLAALAQGKPYPAAPGWTAAPLKDFAENVLGGADPVVVGADQDAKIAGTFGRYQP
ncbi:hypothetical protein ACFRCG_30270 [Embleya sp. NPDC056575]|uniref:hypothetical protein n=1 Tax=unclassified Embleya TaxID=2699296 RepID=UPI0036C07B66